ncbi:MAG: tetratricopeptide repeat protein [Bacteroidia bacterium]|nr:tetratricopeptide repeat protein [Bacteroidia bacterium]MDW8159667.1 tetratricopeptide repeat protein [Bacteroidia bacterium]
MEAATAICQNIASIYNSQGEYGKALEHYQKAVSICLDKEEQNQKQLLGLIYEDMAKVYEKLGDYEKASHFLQKAEFIKHSKN